MDTCGTCGGTVDDDNDFDCPHCGEVLKSPCDLAVPEPREDEDE